MGMKTIDEALRKLESRWGPDDCADIRWAQRWARAHGVRKAGRDYHFSDKQVKQMALDYSRRGKQ